MAQRRKPPVSKRLSLSANKAVFVVLALVLLCVGIVGVLRMGPRPVEELIRFSAARDSHAAEDGSGEEGSSSAQDGAAADEGDGGDSADRSAAALPAKLIIVHVDGAVVAPGVYTIEDDDPRVVDAVECAGGLTDDASTQSINLAAPLVDGQKIYVQRQGESGGTAAATASAVSGASASAGADASQPVNINLATAEQLQSLPGVGEKTAQAIVEERESRGPFASPEDLMRVSGIGEKKFQKLEGLICV